MVHQESEEWLLSIQLKFTNACLVLGVVLRAELGSRSFVTGHSPVGASRNGFRRRPIRDRQRTAFPRALERYPAFHIGQG